MAQAPEDGLGPFSRAAQLRLPCRTVSHSWALVLRSLRNFHVNPQSTWICNSQRLETTQVSFSGRRGADLAALPGAENRSLLRSADGGCELRSLRSSSAPRRPPE